MAQDNKKLQDRSVIKQPLYEQAGFTGFVMWLGSIADDIDPWGGSQVNFHRRDIQLRNFWQTEPTLASAIYAITIRDASFSWTLKGDQPRTIDAMQEMLHNANLGKGWLDFIIKWRQDFLTQDNGAFFEVIRQTDSPDSPCIGINHLDSSRCRRTGVPDWPVVYTDRLNRDHKLMPWQVVAVSDFPSPVETANGIGFCAVSRVLRNAQLMRDFGIRDRERASGMDPKTLYIVSGVSSKEIETVLGQHREQQVEQGYTRYNPPVIFTTLDPKSPASTETLDLAPKPDQWSKDEEMRWYITLLAMALGVDYQDLAPLPARGIGGSMQSEILHQKAKGKGPELFMKTIEHILNFHGILPDTVTFEYQEKDKGEDAQDAVLLRTYAEAHRIFADAGILSPQSSRNMMLDEGILTQEIFDAESQGQPDKTPEVTAPSDVRVDETEEGQAPVEEGEKQKLSDFAEEERRAWEEAMARDIGRGLTRIYKLIEEKLLPSKAISFGRKQSPEDMVDDPKLWREFRLGMAEEMAPNARNVFLGAAQVNEALGLAVNMDGMNLEALNFTKTYITEWLAELEATTRDGLRAAISAWQETGLGKRGLPDLVKSIEPLFGKARAERIAATETCRVFDQGNLAAHESAGVEYEQWLNAGDDKVRPEHRDGEGLGGKVFRLHEGPRPSDFINCRCARVPIATDEALEILGET